LECRTLSTLPEADTLATRLQHPDLPRISAQPRAASAKRRTFVILSQVYIPDPAAVGQHMADAAAEIARRGHRVVVFTADRGYDDPEQRYPARETIDGVEVVRLPFSSLGKGSIALRLVGGMLFALQALVRGLFVDRIDAVVVSTAPPMGPVSALLLSALRRAPIKFWVMDLNPDQLVALRVVEPDSMVARGFDVLNRMVLRRASDVVVLDPQMARRVLNKRDVSDKLQVIPPWSHEALATVEHENNPFRQQHGLEGKFVIMYSGNHSPSHPLSTILAAAERLTDEPDLVFLFVGGGLGKLEVEASKSPNVRSLPYQPLDRLTYSLSAADVHLVAMGPDMVGIVHPSKVYGAMAIGRPILLLGPPGGGPVGEVIDQHSIGWQVQHGDVDGAVGIIREMLNTDPAQLRRMGARARKVIDQDLSKAALCGKLCDVLER
jgi:colanic acid biosynthesis glycosyl transferase WcaI